MQWLKYRLFITCTQDFCSTQVDDNLSYQEAADYAIASLNLTNAGSAFLDAQIDAYTSSDENNLVWRSWTLNNPDVIEETRPFLQALTQYKNNQAKADKEAFLSIIATLSNKFVKAYAKANDIIAKKPSATSSWSRSMLYCDRKLTTLGDRFFNYTRLGKTLDSMTEMLHKSLFTVASGVPFNNVVRLSVSQLDFGDVFRQQVLDNVVREGNSNRIDTHNAYKFEFDKFSQTEDGMNQLKKTRIKILVLFFNVLEYKSQAKKLDGDPASIKELAKYLSALTSTINTATGIIMPAVEHGVKNQVLTNTIKWLGAGAGSTASVLTLSADLSSAISEIKGEQRWGYISLSGVKVFVDAKIAANALQELLPLVIKRGWMASEGMITRGVIGFATMESIAWLAGWEVMIGLYFIDQLLILYYGNDLQKWCDQCVFGLKAEDLLRSTEFIELNEQRKNTLKQQMDNVAIALKVIQ